MPAALRGRPGLERDVGRAEQPAVLRMQRKLPDRAALSRSTRMVAISSGASSNSSVHCRSATRIGNTPRPFGVSTYSRLGAAVGGGGRRQNAALDQRAQPRRENVLGKPEVF